MKFELINGYNINTSIEKKLKETSLDKKNNKVTFFSDISMPMKMKFGGKNINIEYPSIVSIDEMIINELKKIICDLEEEFNIKRLNRIRFDLAIMDNGDVKIYELNTKNPLSIYLNMISIKEYLDKDKIFGRNKELFELEIEMYEEMIVDIFKNKIPVFAVDNSNEMFISEVEGMKGILKNNGVEDIIEIPWEDSIKYINNDKYIVWWAGTLDDRKISQKILNSKNFYGGMPNVGKKDVLVKDSIAKSQFAIKSDKFSPYGDFSVLDKSVVKVIDGEKNHGGKGVYFSKDEVNVFEKNISFIAQDELPKDKKDIDISVIRDSNGTLRYFASTREAAKNQKIANVTSGGSWRPLILNIEDVK